MITEKCNTVRLVLTATMCFETASGLQYNMLTIMNNKDNLSEFAYTPYVFDFFLNAIITTYK